MIEVYEKAQEYQEHNKRDNWDKQVNWFVFVEKVIDHVWLNVLSIYRFRRLFFNRFFRNFVGLIVGYDDVFVRVRVCNLYRFSFVQMIVWFLSRESQIVFVFCDFIEICRFSVFAWGCDAIVNVDR